MNSENPLVLIILSAVVLVSHFFNLLTKVSRIPSVILLIGLGALLKIAGNYFNLEALNISSYLSFLGSIGLILIVLEGAADLKIQRKNLAIVEGSFSAAVVILLLSTTSIAALFHFWFHSGLRSSLVNAIPLAVISSAIAIPTVVNFTKDKKEFLTYEAIFSDILGIMFFNFMITQGVWGFSTTMDFISKLVIVVIASVGGALVLFWTMHNMKTQTKFFIILSLLALIYAVGKMFHLSSLLLVFVFGLLLNNFTRIPKVKRLVHFNEEEVTGDIEQFKLIVAESAFLIRTFFFVAFGYSIDVFHAFNLNVISLGIPIVLILFLVRFVYLKYVIKAHLFPEIFIAPKGLVTILLFYSIPPSLLINSFSGGEVLFVILVSSLLMIVGGFSQKHLKTELPESGSL